MELNVAVDAEQINKAVAEAIIKSAIGEQVARIVAEHVKKLDTSWNNPIENIVQAEIRKLIVESLLQTHGDRLRELVGAAVTEKLTSDFVAKIIERGLS